jgi:hypothetical protein
MNAAQVLAGKMQHCVDMANNEELPVEMRLRCMDALKLAMSVAYPLLQAEQALDDANLLMLDQPPHILLPYVAGRT